MRCGSKTSIFYKKIKSLYSRFTPKYVTSDGNRLRDVAPLDNAALKKRRSDGGNVSDLTITIYSLRSALHGNDDGYLEKGKLLSSSAKVFIFSRIVVLEAVKRKNNYAVFREE